MKRMSVVDRILKIRPDGSRDMLFDLLNEQNVRYNTQKAWRRPARSRTRTKLRRNLRCDQEEPPRCKRWRDKIVNHLHLLELFLVMIRWIPTGRNRKATIVWSFENAGRNFERMPLVDIASLGSLRGQLIFGFSVRWLLVSARYLSSF